MNKVALMIFSLIIGFSAIAKQPKHKKAKKPGGIESIKLQRTGCFGRCPAYIIQLDKNGLATYSGIRFTADTGTFEKKAGEKTTADIFGKVNANRLDTCKDEYPSPAPDLPGMIITIKYAKATKVIDNANFGPAVVRQLADAMDGLIPGKKVDDTWHKVNVPVTK